MAFGFQNCCDTEEYFYLNGIPATVSENEVYQISTLEGVDFCATYTELPELFYQPLTYTLDVMVEQTSCTTCLESLPCPETIEVPLDNNVTISNYNECSVLTEIPLEVVCQTIQPVAGEYFGQVGLLITGGQPPFQVFSANTTTLVSGAAQEGPLTILLQAPPGDYCYDVIDSYNAIISLCCTIDYSPEPLFVSCQSTPSSVWEDTGSVNLNINGESPFTVYYQGSEVTLPLTQLSAGTYDFTVIDSIGQTDDITCTVNQTIPNYTYPQYLCMTFQFCQASFYLTFVSAGTSNYLPYYTLQNPDEIGVTSMTLSADTSFNWFTSTAYSNTSLLNVPPTCSLSPSSSGNVQFTKNTTGTSPLGTWASSGIFNTQTTVSGNQCVEVSPSFVATPGPPVCTLDESTSNVTITPQGGSGPPYTYYVDGGIYTSPIIGNLSTGLHTVQISDSNFNLSTVGSVIIGTSPVQNLTIDGCSQLLTNLNSTAGYLNADFSVSTTGFNSWPVGTTVEAYLSFTVTYNYSGTDTDGGESQPSLTDWLFDVGITNIPISTTINGVLIPLNPTPFDSNWIQVSSVDYIHPVYGFQGIHCVVYNRTQTWQSTSPVTLNNGVTSLITSINTLIQGEQFTQPQSCTGANLLINFQLNLTNLEVVTGDCTQISESEGLLLSYTAIQQVPVNGYNVPFIGSFQNGTGCETQPICNQQFDMTGALPVTSTISVNSYVIPDYSYDINNNPQPAWIVFSDGTRTILNNYTTVASVRITKPGTVPLTIGQTYYLKFVFTTVPTSPLYMIFDNYQITNTIAVANAPYTIFPQSITANVPYYIQVQKITSNGGGGAYEKTYVFSGVKGNAYQFSMQISPCPWI